MQRRTVRIISVFVLLCLVWGLPIVPVAYGQTSSITHVVQPGENLFRISLRYGVTVQAIAEANGIANPNLIIVGQTLVIPGGTSGTAGGSSQPPATTTQPPATQTTGGSGGNYT